ncbi:NAD(P)/FAD-dependent oxidoreductase [Mucilaginibacter sp. X4EP1]|uniref:NAD(P)/FAD-dependent oxidoreductase n=1 Tax=Mucilaginibacter sp. X4EP1 TaxID=2723092 RepID=UPI002167B5A8|nr:NAD(P)/FAD-dependent oxidoreductase [Mucilaginibacter sp. X4EP1]MCS3812008.1 NADH dehydrogenase [Mucilaginibacter sp. X4EP1]
MKRVVIIGGGFAGINLAKNLAANDGFSIIVVDRNNYNFFPPLLYQVSTAFLEASSICYPYRKLFGPSPKIAFRIGELVKISPGENKILLSTGELDYDILVLATGTQTNYFGIENVKINAMPMKTFEDALNLRNHLLQNLEKAAITGDPGERNRLLTVVVAGAGPTGIEISGMLAEINRKVITREYPEVANGQFEAKIYLVDGVSTVLATMGEASQKYTLKSLIRMGIEVKLGVQVKEYLDKKVILSDGEVIETETLVWAAGVSASAFIGIPIEWYGKGKRLIVDEFNKIKGAANIYAIGDTCILTSDKLYPNGHPQMAQPAIQQGANLAKNLILLANNGVPKPFKYADKGSMAIIGKYKAVVEMAKPRMNMNGFFAWFIWLFVHLRSLINVRNKLKTFANWVGTLTTRDQSLRFIIRPGRKL